MRARAPSALLLALALAEAKLPHDELTDHITEGARAAAAPTRCSDADPATARGAADCWVPDYCKPQTFKYQLCKIRLRSRRNGRGAEKYACPEGQFCEELDCAHKCFLPTSCECHAEGKFVGRMMCEGSCYKHPSTQWGLCVPIPDGWDDQHQHGGDDDDGDELALPVDFHFWTPDGPCPPMPPRRVR